jgi:hypothetical protein
MKTLKNLTLALTAVLAAGAFGQAARHTEIKTPPLRKFSIPQPKRIASS